MMKKLKEVEKLIIKVLDTKIKTCGSTRWGDKFIEFNNGVVKVQLRGSCAGCPSSVMQH